MDESLAQKAISAALSGKWEEAITLNKKILEQDSNDVDALIRLARAYAETNEIKQAKETLQKVIQLDPYNTIALRALAKWKSLNKNNNGYHSTGSNPHFFLEEPGKTKIVLLKHLCSPDAIAELDAGDPVKLNINTHKVSVNSQAGKYIGRLPDDISARIKKLSSLGYQYTGVIRSSDKNGVKILIRETVRPSNYSDIPSFPGEKINYVTFTPPELVHEDQNTEEIDEEIANNEEDSSTIV